MSEANIDFISRQFLTKPILLHRITTSKFRVNSRLEIVILLYSNITFIFLYSMLNSIAC